MKPVLVEWVDSRQPGANWRGLEEPFEEPCQCVTAGHLVYDGADYIVIALTVADTEDACSAQACGVMTIPTVAIKRMAELHTEPGHALAVTSASSQEPA